MHILKQEDLIIEIGDERISIFVHMNGELKCHYIEVMNVVGIECVIRFLGDMGYIEDYMEVYYKIMDYINDTHPIKMNRSGGAGGLQVGF